MLNKDKKQQQQRQKEAEWVENIAKNKCEKSLQKLASSYKRVIHKKCIDFGLTKEEKEDVYQEVLIRFWTKAHLVDKKKSYDGSVNGYLVSIIYNVCCKFLRDNKERYFYSIDDDDMGYFFESKTANENYFEIEVEKESEQREIEIKKKKITKAIKTLKSKQKEVLKLYFLNNLNHSEISNYLGVKESTSKSNLSRAKQNVIERVEQTH
jgi:RNA polymerase sigma-70 factor (ECF subfamily)